MSSIQVKTAPLLYSYPYTLYRLGQNDSTSDIFPDLANYRNMTAFFKPYISNYANHETVSAISPLYTRIIRDSFYSNKSEQLSWKYVPYVLACFGGGGRRRLN